MGSKNRDIYLSPLEKERKRDRSVADDDAS